MVEWYPAHARIGLACGATRNLSTARFEKNEQGVWMLMSASARNERPDASSATYGSVEGPFGTATSYPGCPHCGARSYVKCGACGHLSCWRGSGEFSCGWCANRGPVEGTIQTLARLD